ncbi:MAG: hypothetical protein PHY16_05965 [Methylobacter sp.]|nr:hypothetical protein [Methylobacter sp.]
MSRYLISFVIFSMTLGLPGFVDRAHAAQNTILAINIALVPDATMTWHAEAANAQLLKLYPQGFTLVAAHELHITLLQRYVRAENLNKIYVALDTILASQQVTRWKLKATHYDFTPWNTLCLGSIAVESNDNLSKLQQQLINAMAPLTETTGTATAFVIAPGEPAIDKTTINYVTTFVPEQTGKNFKPHVTTGLARQGDIQDIIGKPFSSFTFSPVAVSVYQIGHFGTARKKLKEWR